MKFRKEYQTYLLIVIAIIIAGYFLKHFFFNKKKKVIEGQEGTTTYYRVAFSSTDLINTDGLTLAQQDLLKELILMEYDASKIITDNTTGSKYVKPDVKYASVIGLIPATLLIKDAATGDSLGLKVVSICGRLEYFKYQAAAAADTADTAAAAAAYDYARLILSNEKAYNGNVTTMAGIAAANLLTIMGQPTITNYNDPVVTTAYNTAINAYKTAAAYAGAGFSAGAAANAAEAAAEPDIEAAARDAAKAAGYANTKATNATFQSEENYFETTDTSNANYIKVITKYNNDPANLKAAFITAAGLIYQQVYTIIGGP